MKFLSAQQAATVHKSRYSPAKVEKQANKAIAHLVRSDVFYVRAIQGQERPWFCKSNQILYIPLDYAFSLHVELTKAGFEPTSFHDEGDYKSFSVHLPFEGK